MYPKKCKKCDQFGEWCFCEPKVSPADTPVKVDIDWDIVPQYTLQPDGSIEKVFCDSDDLHPCSLELWGREATASFDRALESSILKYTHRDPSDDDDVDFAKTAKEVVAKLKAAKRTI